MTIDRNNIMKALRRERSLLFDRHLLLLARYDHQLPPAIYERLKQSETEIAGGSTEHHERRTG